MMKADMKREGKFEGRKAGLDVLAVIRMGRVPNSNTQKWQLEIQAVSIAPCKLQNSSVFMSGGSVAGVVLHS